MASLHIDPLVQADDSTAAARVMFRLTAQLMQPAAEVGKRQPRRAHQRLATIVGTPRQPHRAARTDTVAAPEQAAEAACPIVWTGLTARPREPGRVWLESVWWTAPPPAV